MMKLRTLSVVLPGLLAAGVPRTAEACHDFTVCVSYNVGLTGDLLVGDYLTTLTSPARGARVMIMRPPPEPPIGAYLDDEGCVDLESQFRYGITMAVYTEAVLGPDNNVWLRAFGKEDVSSDAFDEPVIEPTEYVLPVHLHGVGEETEPVEVSLPIDPRFNLLAYASETIYRMTTVYGVEIPEPRTLQLAFHEETEFGTFHFGEGTIVIAEEDYGFHENPDNTFNLFNKFVVSHEVSHWVHNMVYLDEGIFPPLDAGDYRYDAQDADCNWCTNLDEPEECPEREHALRSAELSHAAVIEGFAQFGAAVTYNDPTEGDGVFRYYKDLAAFPEYDDLVDGYYQVSLENDDEGGTDAWVQTMCLPDYNSPDNEGPHVSSEIDWMRTFWRFVTDDTYSGSLASVADVHTIVVEAAHNNWNADIIDPGPPPIVDDTYAWQAVVEAADDLLQPVQDERLGEITAALGVYNPPP